MEWSRSVEDVNTEVLFALKMLRLSHLITSKISPIL